MKKIVIILLSVFLLMCCAFGLTACVGGGDDSGDNPNTEQPNNPDDGNSSGEDEIPSDETPAITSVEGATIEGTDIYMFVDSETDSVPLLNKVIVSAGNWDLYSDILGQNRIPTKIASGSSGVLADGDNTFYIMLEDDNADLVNIYTLTIYRSYAIIVKYYDYMNKQIYSDFVYTGYEYVADYRYSTEGYTFNTWQEDGVDYTTRILWDDLSLRANMTPNSYTVALNTDGGTLEQAQHIVAYNSAYVFPIPKKIGYTFLGWYNGDIQITKNNGQSISVWKYTNVSSVSAKWEINQYTVSVDYVQEAGTITGVGKYDYNTNITLTASAAKIGYDFIGWFDGETLLTTSNTYNFTLPDRDMNFIAMYQIWEDLLPFNFTSTLTNCQITSIKDKSIKEIIVPDYVTSIRSGAFSGCNSLESITVPFIGSNANVTSTSEAACFGYIFGKKGFTYLIPKTLKSVIITDENITTIGDSAFKDCSELTNIVIPDGVKTIGWEAFEGCSNLTSIEIPSGVTSIGFSAFNGCSSLTSIEIPSGVTSIARYAFAGCKSLTNIEIPSDVTTIAEYAFSYCRGLNSIRIPCKVTDIGWTAFQHCDGLTKIEVDNNNIKYTSENNCIIEKATKKLILGCKNSIIPNDITYIASAAFSGCTGLVSIVIPNTVETIGTGAFSDCANLQKIVLPKSVTRIATGAFDNCPRLIIYAEATSKPLGWHLSGEGSNMEESWNPDKRPVIWGYTGE